MGKRSELENIQILNNENLKLFFREKYSNENWTRDNQCSRLAGKLQRTLKNNQSKIASLHHEKSLTKKIKSYFENNNESNFSFNLEDYITRKMNDSLFEPMVSVQKIQEGFLKSEKIKPSLFYSYLTSLIYTNFDIKDLNKFLELFNFTELNEEEFRAISDNIILLCLSLDKFDLSKKEHSYIKHENNIVLKEFNFKLETNNPNNPPIGDKIYPAKNSNIRKKIIFSLISIVVLSAVVFTVYKYHPSKKEYTKLNVIILPFQRLSKDAHENKIEDAIETDLLELNDNLGGLTVTNIKNIEPPKSEKEIVKILKDFEGDIAFYGAIDGKSESMKIKLKISDSYSILANYDFFNITSSMSKNNGYEKIKIPDIENLDYLKDKKFIFYYMNCLNAYRNDTTKFFSYMDSTISNLPEIANKEKQNIENLRLFASSTALELGLFKKAYQYAYNAHKNDTKSIRPLISLLVNSYAIGDFKNTLEICNYILDNKTTINFDNNNTFMQIVLLCMALAEYSEDKNMMDILQTLNELNYYESKNKCNPIGGLVLNSLKGNYDEALLIVNDTSFNLDSHIKKTIKASLRLLKGDLRYFISYLESDAVDKYITDVSKFNHNIRKSNKPLSTQLKELFKDPVNGILPILLHIKNTDEKDILLEALKNIVKKQPFLLDSFNFNKLNNKQFNEVIDLINCNKKNQYENSTVYLKGKFGVGDFGYRLENFLYYVNLSNLYSDIGHSVISQYYGGVAMNISLKSLWYLDAQNLNFDIDILNEHYQNYSELRGDSDFVYSESTMLLFSEIDSLFYNYYLDEWIFDEPLFYTYKKTYEDYYGLPLWFIENFADLSYDMVENTYAISAYNTLLKSEPLNIKWNLRLTELYMEKDSQQDSLALVHLNKAKVNWKKGRNAEEDKFIENLINKIAEIKK